MKTLKLIGWLAMLALIAAGILWLINRHSATPAAEEAPEKEPPAEVSIAKVARKSIAETDTAYGSVIAQPARVQVVAAAFETRVRHILVAPGELVKSGTPLVEIEPSVAAQLQLRQAQNAADAANRDMEQTRSRFNLKLATNSDIGAAEKAATDAQMQLESLKQAGMGADSRIRAALDGMVAKVDVQNGQIVPSGGALVETITADDIEAKIGIEPVHGGGAAVTGKVRLITHRTDTDTRLVDIYVSLPLKSGLLLDSYVKATFQHEAQGALVVPLDALQTDDQGYCIFAVQEKKAARISVEPGIETESEVQVSGTGVSEGQTIATTGSHELNDGDEVEPQEAKEQ